MDALFQSHCLDISNPLGFIKMTFLLGLAGFCSLFWVFAI